MIRATHLYPAALLTALAAFAGLVAVPQVQLAGLTPVEDAVGDLRPFDPGGRELAGRRAYISLGCVYCHTQQLRPAGCGADIERGWGARRTVARDYIHDQPPLLGTLRTGPDLADVGSRQPSAAWHYLHLLDPQRATPGSIMPPHAFLFRPQAPDQARSVGTLAIPGARKHGPSQWVPTDEGAALVAYLLSLRCDYDVPEVGP